MLKVTERMKQGMERMRRATTGKPDRVPVYAQLSHHSARLADMSTRSFFTDAETFLRCELEADEFYELDSPTLHYDCYNIEAEALGSRMIWKENEFPEVDPGVPLLSSVENFGKMKPLRPGIDGRMPYVVDINRMTVDLGLPPKIRFCGVFTLASKLLGFENLIVAIMTQPDRVHRLMEHLADEIIGPWIEYQRDQVGTKATATGSEALASPPLVTVDIVREFCFLYTERLEENVGGIRLAGIWGESCLENPVELLDIKRKGAKGAVQALDPDATNLGPAYYREYADRFSLAVTMGIDAVLIRNGPVHAIQDRARRFIDGAGRDGRFVLYINDIPYDTPVEHVKSVVSVGHGYAY